MYKNSILTPNGYNNDIWTFSVTHFTCIIIVLNLRLIITSKALNAWNLVGIYVTSIGLYLTYAWFSNYMTYSLTYLSFEVIWSSPQFWLILIMSVGSCYITDRAVQTIVVNFTGRPDHYLRTIVATYGRKFKKDNAMPEHFEEEFYRLHNNLVKKYISKD